MGRKQNNWDPDALPTIWQVPDDLWELIVPVLAELDPPKRTGRPRTNPRPILDAIIYRMRTGVQWNHLPKEFPDDSVVHAAFQRWVRLGVLERIWAVVQNQCADLDGVDWAWQSADAMLRKARSGGTGLAGTRPTGARTG
jgi:transposase